jgi:hypothetical protein
LRAVSPGLGPGRLRSGGSSDEVCLCVCLFACVRVSSCFHS